MSKTICIIFFCFLSSFSLVGQQDSTQIKYDTSVIDLKKLSAEDLQKYHDDPKFNYEVVKTEIGWWQDFKTWLGNIFLQFFEIIFGVEEAVGALGFFLKILPYVLLILLLYLLIRFFINVNSQALIHSKINESIVSLSEDEHIIKNEDIKQLIKKALDNKNYRLAIRFYYLHILKLMTDREIISWEIQKTNDDYLHEINTSELKLPFTKITRLYDYVWYGNFAIDEPSFLRAQAKFTALQKKLGDE